MPQQSVSRAAVWMAGWLIMTLGMTVGGRQLAHDIPVVVTMMFRSLGATLVLGPIMLWQGQLDERFAKWPVHVARNVVHYAAQFAWIYALALIPMAQVVSIEFTLPIWATILAALFLNEKLTSWKVIAIILGFTGIIAIVKPDVSSIDAGHLYALGAALGFSVTVTLTKYLTRTDSPLTVVFTMFAMQTLIGAVPAYLFWQWPQPQNWIWVAVVALAGTFSHFCLAKAISLADATIVLPMDFLRVPLTALLGLWLFSEGFDGLSVLGAALILAANAINIFKARKA